MSGSGHHPQPETKSEKVQAKAPETQTFGEAAFEATDGTVLRWLGIAGFLINSRGTTIMVDPLLRGFDMPIMIEMPIASENVPRLDAVLVTHSDNDHYSVPTCRDLAGVTDAFHSTRYVASLMTDEGLPAHGHAIGDDFSVGAVRVEVTPADHAWQNATHGASTRVFQPEDACGFWMTTPDGTIWAPGDSRLIPEHHLQMPAPDALLFDFSDSEWHFGLAGAVTMANAYPGTPLLLHHWGSVDAPDFAPFNGDPQTLYDLVTNPERIHVLAPGQPFTLRPVTEAGKSSASGSRSLRGGTRDSWNCWCAGSSGAPSARSCACPAGGAGNPGDPSRRPPQLPDRRSRVRIGLPQLAAPVSGCGSGCRATPGPVLRNGRRP